MPESRHGSAAAAAQAEPADPPTNEKGPDPLIGQVINGRYRIVSVIARGGMGKVYRAEQSPLGRICALKVLNPKYDGDRDPEFHKRFFLEASTAAKLTHPNTVTIFDYGQTDEIYYIAMEYIEGKTLHRSIREAAPFKEMRVAHIAAQVCRSLREAHNIGVVHRDLKPGNILLTDRGDEADNVKVLDFGLVKDVSGEAEDLTQQGLFMGSPKYMAPEQILGTEISPRTDIYSLGVMMYEMLCGKVPFDRGASVGTLMAHVNEAPAPLRQVFPGIGLSPAMEAIVNRCLEKDPAKRFPSMKELLGSLKRVGGDADGLMETTTSESLPIVRPEGIISSPPNSQPSQSGTTLQRSALPATPIFASPSVTDSMAHVASPSAADLAAVGRKGGGRWAFLVVGVLILGAGGAAYAFLQREAQGPPAAAAAATTLASVTATAATAPASPTPSPAAQPAAAAAATAAGPSMRSVRIESEPPGGTVAEDSTELCSSTPCEILLKGDAVKAEHRLRVTKRGFRNTYVSFGPSDEKVTVKLEVIPIVAAPQPQAPKRDPNYKPSPY